MDEKASETRTKEKPSLISTSELVNGFLRRESNVLAVTLKNGTGVVRAIIHGKVPIWIFYDPRGTSPIKEMLEDARSISEKRRIVFAKEWNGEFVHMAMDIALCNTGTLTANTFHFTSFGDRVGLGYLVGNDQDLDIDEDGITNFIMVIAACYLSSEGGDPVLERIYENVKSEGSISALTPGAEQ